MRLFVIGATGRIGTEIVHLARTRGHEVTAMRTCGVSRLGIVSAALLFPEKALLLDFFRWFLKNHTRDLREMERIVESSGLDWTIARPPRLTNSPNPEFRALPNALPPGSRATSFRSVAAFLLDAVEHQSYIRQVVGLTQGEASELAAAS
jgi:uncharacterized protein YbjT (DUF2867 family)